MFERLNYYQLDYYYPNLHKFWFIIGMLGSKLSTHIEVKDNCVINMLATLKTFSGFILSCPTFIYVLTPCLQLLLVRHVKKNAVKKNAADII